MLALGANSDFESAVDRSVDGSLSNAERQQARQDELAAKDRADTLALVSDIFLVSTIVAAGVTVLLYFLQSDEEPSSSAALRTVPVVLPGGGGGVVLRAEFLRGVSMRRTKSNAVAVLALLATGCSALVNPDESRLGGDGGGSSDGSTPDATMSRDGGGSDTGLPDGTIVCATDCDDGVACTSDACVAGSCVNTPDDSMCADGMRCNPVSDCIPIVCTSDADCDDGLFCTGTETCAVGEDGADPSTGCRAGVPPSCTDDLDCTSDACDEDADACAFVPDDTACDDGVDCTVDSCDVSSGCVSAPDNSLCETYCVLGAECHPGAGGCIGGVRRTCNDGTVCTVDSCDDAAAACVNDLHDDDVDGYGAMMVSGIMCAGGMDCDDTDPDVNPAATEACNGRDDNCNGMIDEGCPDSPDTCRTAYEIPVVVGGRRAVAHGSLTSLADDYRTACGSTGGRDAVYYVDVTTTVDLEIDTIGSAADTVLAVAETCSSAGFGLACEDDIDSTVITDSRIWVHRFGPTSGSLPRRLFILVDGYSSSALGAYTVRVLATPARFDSCALPIDISGGGSLVGYLTPSAITIGNTGTCQPPGSSADIESIARITGPGTTMAFTAYSNDFQPDLYVRQFLCGTGGEVACAAGGGGAAMGYSWHTELTTASTAARPYFVFIDGAAGTSQYWLTYEP